MIGVVFILLDLLQSLIPNLYRQKTDLSWVEFIWRKLRISKTRKKPQQLQIRQGTADTKYWSVHVNDKK